ncbi:uncharacterized protein LOC132721194 [Ruditapes philippinarum]|uniref:uncharacterized protein LOC132721194 n=1 Tax=Ruditapes philippinarum TaxID=129788 RepID=UPI00295C37D8|nr:uncharacterized protein LOC132721194 [Ruditapes philippinarum]
MDDIQGIHKIRISLYRTDSPAKADKKKSVAKKSTTQGSTLNTGQIWEAPWIKIKKDKGGAEDKKPFLKVQSQDKFTTSTICSGGNTSKNSKYMTTVLQERLAPSEDAGTVVKHVCSRKCLNNKNDDPKKLKGNNPLLIPLFYGWERHVAKTKPYGRRVVFYCAPCGRSLCNLDEGIHSLKLRRVVYVWTILVVMQNCMYIMNLFLSKSELPTLTFIIITLSRSELPTLTCTS